MMKYIIIGTTILIDFNGLINKILIIGSTILIDFNGLIKMNS